jgi:hypothetical protein
LFSVCDCLASMMSRVALFHYLKWHIADGNKLSKRKKRKICLLSRKSYFHVITNISININVI